MTMTRSKDALCIKNAVIDGGNSTAGLTLTGSVSTDTLVKCIAHQSADPNCIDYTSSATLGASSEGTISVTNTTGAMYLDVMWIDNSA